MKALEKSRILLRRGAMLVAAALLLLLPCFFAACSDGVKISLALKHIELTVGERRDILPYIVFSPSTTDDKSIGLSTGSDCIEIDGTAVIAVKSGVAELKVKAAGGTATLTVNVIDRKAESLSVVADGKLVQTVAEGVEPSAVLLSAYLNKDAEQTVGAEWFVDGIKTSDGDTFLFAPKAYGEYIVTAEADGLTAAVTVGVYRKTEVEVVYSGVTAQTDGCFTPVTFTARENADSRNPRSVFEWSVNGEVRGSGRVFEFTPKDVGEYKITLCVNGEDASISGGDGVTVTAEGRRAPLGEVVFDDTDSVYIRWSDGEHVSRVQIVSPDGKRVDIERSDAQHAYRFKRGSFDAEGLIEVCAQAPSDYKITLIADGKREFTFTQYPATVQKFTDDKVLCGNRFISSGDDAENYITELYACGIKQSSCYSACDVDIAVGSMQKSAERLGLEIVVTVEPGGRTVAVQLSDFENEPTRFGSGSAERMYTELPHIEYDRSALRPSVYVLASDRIARSVEVVNSEQLLYAVSRGFKPLPEPNSEAAYIYSAARNKLLNMIGADYTAEQKIHAVYDWLQWVSVRDESASITSCGRFLEGVFGSTTVEMPPTGIRRAAVTSEGAAKAFALMCGMEGIECVTVCNADRTRFWNKVGLDGLWYNVDVYGGEIMSAELGVARPSELTSHRGLLIDDDRARELGLVAAGDRYAAFDGGKSYFMQKRRRDGIYYDRYVDDNEETGYAEIEAAVFDAFCGTHIGSVSVPVVGGTEMYMNGTLGAEFFISDKLGDVERERVTDSIIKAAVAYAEKVYGKAFADGTLRVYRADGVVCIVAAVPVTSQTEEA